MNRYQSLEKEIDEFIIVAKKKQDEQSKLTSSKPIHHEAKLTSTMVTSDEKNT